MKKYIRVTEKDSKDNSIIQCFFFPVDEVEYTNVRFDGLDKNKDGKRCYYMELTMRGYAPMRVYTDTDKDTVIWIFDHFCKWLADENIKFAIYDFDVHEDFLRGPAHAKVYSYYKQGL
jgi:hypothetical protein